jgi:DNA processing protein
MSPAPKTQAIAESRNLLIALNTCPGLSRDAICRLSRRPDSWLITEPPGDLGVHPTEVAMARSVAAKATQIASNELQAARGVGAALLTLLDADYPHLLHDLDLPPPVLYVRGTLPRRPAIAVVGSRKADPYGLEIGEAFARELAEAGLTVVSGLARGVDSAAHRGALAARKGRTVAVQGRGIDQTYPRSNLRLADRIPRCGAVVSEFPIGTPPLPHHFPIRNRIIAALATAVLVVQAAPRSGSLITARLGLELGREVFAVPGPIFHERAIGTNSLLADGAALVQRPRDILEALPLAIQDRLRPARTLEMEAPDGVAGEILAALTTHQSLSPEELSRLLSRPVEEVLTGLLELEISNRIRRHPGPAFHLRR